MLDIEGEACWYAAEQGEDVHASMRFVRAYMRYRALNGTPHAGGMTIPQFYARQTRMRTAFDTRVALPEAVALTLVRTVEDHIQLGEN